MPPDPATIGKVITVAENYRRAQNIAEGTRNRLEAMVRRAAADGHSKVALAEAAGLSRRTIYRMIDS